MLERDAPKTLLMKKAMDLTGEHCSDEKQYGMETLLLYVGA